jgi:methyl-accepting chemotaxis protein
MLKNLLISTKLKLNAAFVVLGLMILIILSYTSIKSLESDYSKSKYITTKVNNYKSVMIGGLLVNSASGSYAFNPLNLKPIESAQSGLNKVIEYGAKIKNKDQALFDNFTRDAQDVLNFAKQNHYLGADHVNKLLKVWKPLKFDTTEKIKKLKKEQKRLSEKFKNNLSHLFVKILIIISIITAVVMVLNYLVSKGIVKSLSVLEDSMHNLADGKSSSKIELEYKDEASKVADYFNQYMDNVEKGLKQDKEVINEVKVVIEKINAGLFNTKVEGHANSEEVEELVQEINNMIDRTSSNLSELSKVLMAYGNSNFKYEIPQIDGLTGLMASLLTGIKATGNTIQELMALIDNSNKRLLFSSKDLTKSSVTLSNASNSQASSLEQTAAAIEEVTTTIVNSTQNTVKMTNYAQEVTASANEGKELANDTASAMDNITNEVDSISEAITVIDQIAFQTNILSLNAAVEAATAGEAGKGFAVVAQEVRNLASRSAEAANEIKSLVESAKEKAISGKDISSKMIDGYTKLSSNIENTIDLIKDVASASKEQEQAMTQINSAISELDQATQRNASEASNISEMASVNESLASNLQTAINRTTFDSACKRRVCDIDLIFDTAKLKLNHITFKDEAFEKSSSGNRFTVTNHHQCALGKWIDAHEGEPYAQTKEWEELKQAHKNVHSMTQDVVDLHAGNYANGQLFSVSNNVEKNINIVFDKMNKIRELNCDFKIKNKGNQ